MTATEDLNSRFMYHAPPDEETKTKHQDVRLACRNMAHDLNDLLPEGREKSLAFTHLEEVMMWANAAIARQSDIAGV